MILYAESNFILELAFQQEEVEYCRELIALGNGTIKLVVPSFAITEPYWTLESRIRERKQLYQRFQNETVQLLRSGSYSAHKERFDQVRDILVDSIEIQKKSLDEITNAILQSSEVIPLDADLVARALDSKDKFGLTPQDAFIFASVMSHAEERKGAKCFVTTNRKDFENPDLESELERVSCKLLTKFEHCLGYIRSNLKGN